MFKAIFLPGDCFFIFTENPGMLYSKVLIALVVSGLTLLTDFAFAGIIRRAFQDKYIRWRKTLLILNGITAALMIGTIVWYNLADQLHIRSGINHWVVTVLIVMYFSKGIALIIGFLLNMAHRIRHLFPVKTKSEKTPGNTSDQVISRAQFISQAALITAAIPLSVSVFGISRGAYDYRVRKKQIYLPNLPASFDGIRIGHVSDIHASPAYFKTAVQGGVDLLMQEKADVIFFTGDLVNYRTSEVDGFISVFNKIKAPMGVYSVTGNHDYGHYISWPDEASKQKNFEDFIMAHKALGYDLLMNEHRFLEQGGEKIAIIGVENWGKGRFPKLGRLDMAHQGTEEAAVKLLLSHDPSHWDAQVRPHYPDIDLMFAGHTHGFQMGIETESFRWSPAQYSYKQWADLYQEGNQYLYVNRGFGCIGFLGRIGMPPELTIIELKRGQQRIA